MNRRHGSVKRRANIGMTNLSTKRVLPRQQLGGLGLFLDKRLGGPRRCAIWQARADASATFGSSNTA